jgi:ATP-dependent Zn protease
MTTAKRNRGKHLEATAYHEAGHAVATIELGRAVRRLTILPDAEQSSRGHCQGTTEGEWFHPAYNSDGRTRARVEQRLMITLAGAIAERHFTGHRNNVGASADDAKAVGLARSFCGSTREADAYLGWLAVRTELLITHPLHWPTVKALATALLTEKMLSGKRVREIYTAAAEAIKG